MFLNALPATTATAHALHAFLKVIVCFKIPLQFLVQAANQNSYPLSDGWFCTTQEIWITVHEDSGCNITVFFTSFKRTRLQIADRGCQQSTELSG
jgi:hypothetical protein